MIVIQYASHKLKSDNYRQIAIGKKLQDYVLTMFSFVHVLIGIVDML